MGLWSGTTPSFFELGGIASWGFTVVVQLNNAQFGETRIRELIDEVGRIARTLTVLSATGKELPYSAETRLPSDGGAETIKPETLRAIMRARRLRGSFFPADLFADPAWDIMLDLYQAELTQYRVPVSSLCIASGVPATTALRWIRTMTERGLLVRRDDPRDGRRVFVEMSPETSAAMRHYFAEVGAFAL
ncbi:hypothetical protein GCM10022281_07340 [Sphingomonas rosea]|uniref:HTH marR-type domain-containing protein n=1 Tax=Sphingomonas rosea TaxID=335605 RepID=A0ABP7TS24_9SPHN